jgi:SAM-dependent methyltransferase
MRTPQLDPVAERTECRICGNDARNLRHRVREMMYGTGEEFDYLECADCGCLQLQTIPPDLARYYPSDYVSFSPPPARSRGPLALRARRCRARHYLGRRSALGYLFSAFSKRPPYFDWLAGWGLDTDSRILDVGCGTGSLLLRMAGDGFSRLTGIDLFIGGDIAYPGGVRIHRSSVHELDGKFDFIMLHHSFEHMTDPVPVLGKLRALLDVRGTILIRIPVADCYAWRKYRTCWFEIDAPRHMFLHTTRSMHLLAQQAGFRVVRQFRDSTSEQFILSELYARGISMQALGADAARERYFSPQEIATFKSFARELNARQDGDRAAFFLKPIER